MDNRYNENQKSWIARNWPWALPVGCCSGCLVLILLFVFGVGATIFGVVNNLVELSPLEEALERAEENERVVEFVGYEIDTDGFPNGEISVSNNDGEVDFRVPIKGNRGEGTLIVKGIRKDKKWIYEDLYVLIKETNERINLLDNEKVLESI
ncbi:hypothetical protein BTO06_17845 [Tenacibaculum sp. SZ-18]|uniref:cytochrome c oxidase assembly factor Coa1 family protein n=1 Tax=Tenacibaculum sp. SZ-18 TaxID=754423 RepID=UPI000C2D3219|nr:cytochrome c oxidase assembly factor Coa1 family protein [Tenacibaculum sp. SZ-18]AUC16894.1 hypothetical protein BTO06_17845 [Tenacibaculum sp. SZ-18]